MMSLVDPTESKTNGKTSERWSNLIHHAAEMLRAEGISDSELNARLLAAHILGVWKQSELTSLLDHVANEREQKEFEFVVARRLTHEPLQYIVGETEFYGLRLFTTPAALIPRPETELLVEEAIKEGQHILSKKRDLSILDIGTGTGAIPIALAHYLPSANII